MKLNFLTLGDELTPEATAAEEKITQEFGTVFGGTYAFQNTGSENEFIDALTTSVENDDIVILSAAPEVYVAFKSFVASAFALKTRPSRTLQKRIRESHPDLEAETVDAHATLPAEADSMLSEDGLYSGFGVRAEEQILLVLPLDETRIDYLLEDGVFPYLHDNLDFSQFVDSANLSSVESVPVSAGIRSRLGGSSRQQEEQPYNDAFLRSVLNKLKRRNLTVAIADTKTVDFLHKVEETLGNFDDTIFFTDYYEEKGHLESDEYAVQLAKGTYDSSDKDLGAALTKVYTKQRDDGSREYYIYACVSDGKTANEARVAAEPDETPPQLIYKAIEVLFRIIGQWADTGAAIPQTGPESAIDEDYADELEEEAPEITESRSKNRKTKVAIGTLITLALAGSAAVSLFLENIQGLIS